MGRGRFFETNASQVRGPEIDPEDDPKVRMHWYMLVTMVIERDRHILGSVLASLHSLLGEGPSQREALPQSKGEVTF